jgi:YjbE family integral membrane protein
MDWSQLVFPGFTWDFLLGLTQIILINIVLSGDNAVVIALAVKSLPRERRLIGVAFGAGFAVVLRIVLTFFAGQLLLLTYVKLIGGVLIFWIACNLLLQDASGEEDGREATSIWNAIGIIVLADITMSLDNILALAGASRGSLFLLVLGLITSVPLVVFASTALATLMDRYPIIVYLGAAILGKVSADLIFTDPAVQSLAPIPETYLYVLEAGFAAAVIGVYQVFIRLKSRGAGEEIPSYGEGQAEVVTSAERPYGRPR